MGLVALTVIIVIFATGFIVALRRRVRQQTEIIRHQLESERASEKRYSDLIARASEGIFQTTREGRFLSANPALARLLRYGSPEQLISDQTDLRPLRYVNAARRDEFQKMMTEQGFIEGFQSEVYRRDATVIWVKENARAVRDLKGELLYYEGTMEDITARKQRGEGTAAGQGGSGSGEPCQERVSGKHEP